MRIATAALLLALTTAALPAAAGVYRWVDEAGNVHFTGDLNKVPVDQRAGAGEALGSGRGSLQRMEQAERPVELPPGSAESADASGRQPAASVDEVVRHGGRTEEEWRAKATEYRVAIEQLEEKAEACEGDRFRWAPGAGSRAYAEEANEAAACDRVRFDLDTNRRWLENLLESARRTGAPPGWLRE